MYITYEDTLPDSLPSKLGLVATFSPGCGIRKQLMSEKQDFICLRIDCNSGCCLSETYTKDIMVD